VLLVIFLSWLMTAQALYTWLYGYPTPASLIRFLAEVLTTSRGWTLIVLGNAIGVAYATVTFAISVIAVPLLLDRDVGLAVAVYTSVRAVLKNPLPMALWALIVGVLLVLGSLPAFVGLAIVMPVLGHSTWHLYRRVVE
jgi:uncharacterized membrane protein